MAFKTFAPGVLTSSDVNTFLMQQAVITCTSSTRPSSPVEGMTIYETDTDLYATYTGSAWEYVGGWVTTFAPTLTNFTLGNGTIAAQYATVGDIVLYAGRIVCGSTTAISTTAGTSIIISLPVNAYNVGSLSGAMFATTGGQYLDDSLGVFFPLQSKVATTTTMVLSGFNTNTSSPLVTLLALNTVDWGLSPDVDDEYRWFLIYRRA